MTFNEPATIAREINCNCITLHKVSLNQRHMPKRSQITKDCLEDKSKRTKYNTLNILPDLKGPKEIIQSALWMVVRGYILRPPHGTTPAAVIANKYVGFFKKNPIERSVVVDRSGSLVKHFKDFRGNKTLAASKAYSIPPAR